MQNEKGNAEEPGSSLEMFPTIHAEGFESVETDRALCLYQVLNCTGITFERGNCQNWPISSSIDSFLEPAPPLSCFVY